MRGPLSLPFPTCLAPGDKFGFCEAPGRRPLAASTALVSTAHQFPPPCFVAATYLEDVARLLTGIVPAQLTRAAYCLLSLPGHADCFPDGGLLGLVLPFLPHPVPHPRTGWGGSIFM